MPNARNPSGGVGVAANFGKNTGAAHVADFG